MAWTSDANLAAAVSNAGGAGIIATGGRTVEWTRDAPGRKDPMELYSSLVLGLGIACTG